MNLLLLVTMILALFSPGLLAQNYNPKFNEGLNVAEFLKSATEGPSVQIGMPLPSIELEALGTGLTKKVVVLDLEKDLKVGYVAGGPHHTLVANSPPFQTALMYPSVISQHESQPAYVLLARWSDISSKRNQLLTDAGLLNAKDSGLYEAGVQIDIAAEAFAREKAALQAEIKQYTQQCVGQQENAPCTNWYNRLTAKIAAYNQRVETHNQKVKIWRIDVQSFKNIVASWRSKVQEWEAIVMDFIEDAKAFLVNPNPGTCPPPPAPPPSVTHHVPPETPHFPCKGDHEHYFVYHQGPPPECKLRLVKETRCLDESKIESPLLEDGSNAQFPGFRKPFFK